MRVAAEPKNRTPIGSHAFVRNSLFCSPQIMANKRAVPAAMEMMQFTMLEREAKEPTFTITFRRKK